MATGTKAKVFMNGRSQAVRIPLEYRFDTDEVLIRRDPATGDVILSSPTKKEKKSWAEIFAALDAAGFGDDFMADRNQGNYPKRDEL